MNKQTLFGTFLAAAVMCGCQSSKVKISGRFVGNDAREVYLEQLAPLSPSIVDRSTAWLRTAVTNSGSRRFPRPRFSTISSTTANAYRCCWPEETA